MGHAAALFVSQPALSQQIRALEERVGVPLFVRHPRGVELTEAGEVLLGEARELLAQADRLEEAVEGLARAEAAALRIGIPPGLDPTLLPGLLASLREAHADARVEVKELAARFQDSAQLSTTIGKVAAGEGITLSVPPWLEGVAGIVWRPLTDPRIEIRTAAAWRPANRSPLLRALVDLLAAHA